MAYMNQEMKKEIHALLKAVMPKGWKFTTGVENHSTIVLNIWSADVDLCQLAYENALDAYEVTSGFNEPQFPENFSPNHNCIERYFKSNSEVLETFKKIVSALNLNNYNNSDVMTDYFDVGHYITINIGKWNKPFIFNNPDATKVA